VSHALATEQADAEAMLTKIRERFDRCVRQSLPSLPWACLDAVPCHARRAAHARTCRGMTLCPCGSADVVVSPDSRSWAATDMQRSAVARRVELDLPAVEVRFEVRIL